jgi:hypothetical protein
VHACPVVATQPECQHFGEVAAG